MCAFVYVCVCVCFVCVYLYSSGGLSVPVHVNINSRDPGCVSFSIVLLPFFWADSLTKPGTHYFGETAWQASSWDPNRGTDDGTANHWTMETSPHPYHSLITSKEYTAWWTVIELCFLLACIKYTIFARKWIELGNHHTYANKSDSER